MRLPFATGQARLRLLYELPLTGCERRILVLGSHADASSAIGPEQMAKLSTLQVLDSDSFSSASPAFDAVLLPGTLITPGSVSATEHLRHTLGVLKPGGVVVGHMANILSVHGMNFARHPGRLLSRWPTLRGYASASRCQASLLSLGFVEAECFHVEPHIAAPMALVPANTLASRTHFARTVGRNRSLYGRMGFAVRMFLAQTGLGGWLQPHLFFWARKPC